MQEDSPVARKEMSLKSTLCLRIAIAILVQQRFVECTENCNCRCNKDYICDEINKLKTEDAANQAQWQHRREDLDHLKMLKTFKLHEWKISVDEKIESIKGLKERLDEAESRAKRLETALENTRKDFEEQLIQTISGMQSATENRHVELKNSLQAEVLKVKTETRILKSDIEEEKETRIRFQINVSNIGERMHFVENQTKHFKQVIELEKNVREQLKEQLLQNISRMQSATENRHEELKNVLQAEMLEVKNETKILKSDLEEEKETRIGFQSQLMQNISKEFSEAEKQRNRLKDNLTTEIRKVKDQAKSDVEQEKKSRISSEKQLVQRISRKFTSVESQHKVLKKDLETELLMVKEESKNLKSDIEKEKKVWTEFEEELLLNVSTSFSKVALKSKELKDEFDVKLNDMEKDLKSHIQEEEIARNGSEKNLETLSNLMSTLEMKDREFQVVISDLEERLLAVKNETEYFKTAIKAEKQAREELEVKLQANFSTSTTAQQYLEIWKNLSSVAQKLTRLEIESSFEKMNIRVLQNEIKEIRSNYESRFGRDRLRRRRELERALSEVRKHPSTAENKATPLETVISVGQSVSRIYR